jgi:S-DNA-T family DNA segregation ATPase FtsK/SpoIIIE
VKIKDAKNNDSILLLPLGVDADGRMVKLDLGNAPNLLISGATGSGKTVLLYSIISNLITRNSADELKLILVDRLIAELRPYDGIPHLLTPLFSEPSQIIAALNWATKEADRRLKLLGKYEKEDVDEPNFANELDSMPHIVVIIDEYADVMIEHAREFERCAMKLRRMPKAVGVHLIIATQHPSARVITNNIKASFPARIATYTTNQEDSLMIIGQPGAENLPDKGDMLLICPGANKPVRLQGSYLCDEDVRDIGIAARAKGNPEYNTEVVK